MDEVHLHNDVIKFSHLCTKIHRVIQTLVLASIILHQAIRYRLLSIKLLYVYMEFVHWQMQVLYN